MKTLIRFLEGLICLPIFAILFIIAWIVLFVFLAYYNTKAWITGKDTPGIDF